MIIDTRSRTDLKLYFRKNSIPTESHFADLINGMLNQQEDGLVKLPGDPLSLQAVGNNASDQPLLHFYRNFQDPSPAWKLTLNPRSDPNNAGSARVAGLNISDGDGKSRLFIDRATGNVGIGTLTPGAKLEVAVSAGDLDTKPLLIVKGKSPSPCLTILNNGNISIGTTDAEVHLGGFTKEYASSDRPRVVWLRDTRADWDEGLIKHDSSRSVFARAGFGIHMHASREFGFWSTNWTPLFAIKGGSGDGYFMGKVGIGAKDPLRALQIGANTDAAFTFEPSDASPNAGYIRFGDNTGWKLHLGRSRESSGAQLNTGTTGVLMTLQDDGHVGIGTMTPAGKLEVAVAANDAQTLPLVVKKGSEEYLKIANDGSVTAAKTVKAASFQGSINARDITGILDPARLPTLESKIEGNEPLRIICGTIKADGTTVYGKGFTSAWVEDSKYYVIEFDPVFSSEATTVLVSPWEQDPTSTPAGVLSVFGTQSSVCVVCVKGTSSPKHGFHFIAIGTR